MENLPKHTKRYFIVELSGREREVSKKEYLLHVWFFCGVFVVPVIVFLFAVGRIVFEVLRGY